MQYTTTKKSSRIRILLLAGTLLIVGIVLLDIFSSDSKLGFFRSKESGDPETRRGELLKADELLHARLWQLQHLDQQFASFATKPGDQEELNRSNASIQSMEEAFRKSIDSIDRIGANYDEESGTNDFQNMTSFFKQILENRRFLGNTRQSLLSDSKGPGSDRQTILKLQNEIYEKDKIIASYSAKNTQPDNKDLVKLQNQLGEKEKQILTLEAQVQKEQAEKQQYVQTNQKLQNDITEKDKMIASLGNKKGTGDQKALLNLQNEINAKNKQIGNLESQLQKSQSEKQSYTQTIQKLQADLGEKNKIITASATKKLPDSQKELVNLQNDLNLRLRQVTTLQAQVLKDQTEIRSNSQTIQKLQNELNQKNKETTLASNNKSTTDQKALVSLQNDINEKNKKIQSLETQVQNAQADRQSFTQTINNLQNELIEKNKLIASAGNRRVPTDQKAIVTLQNEIAEKDKRIRSLEDQLQSGIKTVSNTGNPAGGETLRDLQQRNTSLRLAYNNTMTQLGVLQRKYNLLKNEMDILKNQQK